MFKKILIANRGEIAVRIIRACKEMGIVSAAIFSEADAEALHTSLADESYCIGPAPACDSYLNMRAIISAALCCHAEAIHPGCGLLSENAEFAAMCESYGLVFIGPHPNVITQMGVKDGAKKLMRSIGVPVTQGAEDITDVECAVSAAGSIGYPVMLKARAGGGGRGIRVAEDEKSLRAVFAPASLEAERAFGDGAMYIEKFITGAKHIEVQLICDDYGNIVCLGDRDCSVQLRNQKLIEECPAPSLSEETRQKLYEASVKAAKAVGYTGVGTVEFLVSGDDYYFMEMNTRLQVEHSVTEMAMGINIVNWQIRVADGYKLPFRQSEISPMGCAIECRINLDTVAAAQGENTITLLHIPGGFNVRFDTAIYQNYSVPPFYDPLIGKMIVCSKTREGAIRKMRCALSELVITGIEHTAGLDLDIMERQDFLSGEYTTDMLK